MFQLQSHTALILAEILSGKNPHKVFAKFSEQNPEIDAKMISAIRALSYETLRFYGELNAILTILLDRPPSNEHLKALCCLVLCQIRHGKRAEHTVVHNAVKAAEHLKLGYAKGMVNAILRRYLREGVNIPVENEEAHFNHPKWWIQKLKKAYPDAWQTLLGINNSHAPMMLRINRRRISVDQFLQVLQSTGISAKPIFDTAVYLAHPLSVEKIPGLHEGYFSVQDLSAQISAHFLNIDDEMTVLDACSAPGGKSTHLLELKKVKLYAWDVDTERIKQVKSAMYRLKLSSFSPQISVNDAITYRAHEQVNFFDRILLDAPCSASGVVRRNIDIKWTRRETDISKFVEIQAKLLNNLWQFLKPSGLLLYATCSVFREENQQQIDRFLADHPDAEQITLVSPCNEIKILSGQIFPNEFCDGLFYACLKKVSSPV